MVFHTRTAHVSKKKIELEKLAPYALHFAMVVAVGVYVIAGAFAIRQIEATPRERIETLQVAASRIKPDPQEIHRGFINQAHRCVTTAIYKINQLYNCSKIVDGSYLHILDNCYIPELQSSFEKLKELKRIERHTKAQMSNSTSSFGGYEYWSLMDSVLFCFTVITTIGYGNVAPRSFNGRLFVIIYGLVGVPFTMLAIANLGKFLATLLKSWTKPIVNYTRKVRSRCCRSQYTAREKQRLMEKETKRPNTAKSLDDDGSLNDDAETVEDENASYNGFVLFLSFIVYIVVGSFVIATYEPNMDFFEAIYFNFVTLTTIGLGDLVPQSDTYLIITLIYCAVGLALTTIAIEIAADTLRKLHYFGRKVENVSKVQVWFGGKKITMKALVKNLGDQFNVPIGELETLNLDKFVDDAIKVEQGELATLRTDKHWMNSNYWRAIESGSIHYVDEDDFITTQSNQNYYSEF